jgi:chromosome segregation ATPase
MSDDEEGGALVPIKEETVEFTAGLLGATAGLFVGGPVLAFILGAAANYVSKMEGDAAEVVQAVSKSSIQVFNYLTRLDRKYEILDKTKGKLEEAVDGLKAKGSVDPEALAKVEGALETTKSKIEEINDEYDLVGAGMTALGVVGDLVEKAVKKASELNEEYQLSGKALDALKTSVDKAKDAAKEAQTKL